MFVVIQEIWSQVSADYEAVKRQRTLVVEPETTIADIMQWADKSNALGKGDITVTRTDD